MWTSPKESHEVKARRVRFTESKSSLKPWYGRRSVLCLGERLGERLGIDHTELTYRNNGVDRRLTDVHGHVLKDILATTPRPRLLKVPASWNAAKNNYLPFRSR
jgi:hypothetical protein